MKNEETKEKTGNPEVQLADSEMEKVNGGYMLWGKTCKVCGGVINNDPNTPYDIRCHCNEDTTPVWGPTTRYSLIFSSFWSPVIIGSIQPDQTPFAAPSCDIG